MYNAINVAEFNRDRSCCAAPGREKRILYAGAVSPHKGLHILMDAFSMVVKEHPEVRLDVVGWQGSYPLVECFDLRDPELIESVYPFYAYDWISRLKAKLSLVPADAGTYLAHLKERLSPQASRKVAFLGFIPRPDLVDLYYKADVFAFAPIWDEGFGIPPVEAMAAGVPVVATRSGAIPEIVKDQQTGFLVAALFLQRKLVMGRFWPQYRFFVLPSKPNSNLRIEYHWLLAQHHRPPTPAYSGRLACGPFRPCRDVACYAANPVSSAMRRCSRAGRCRDPPFSELVTEIVAVLNAGE